MVDSGWMNAGRNLKTKHYKVFAGSQSSHCDIDPLVSCGQGLECDIILCL